MIRPKAFVAVVNFSCGGQRFAAGDIVPRSPALAAALRYGDRFVVAARHRPAPPAPDGPPSGPADTPANTPADTPTDQPTDGDVDNPTEE